MSGSPALLLKLVQLVYIISGKAAQPPKWNELESSYSFDNYMNHFNKNYEAKPKSFLQKREKIFKENLEAILKHNNDPTKNYKKGVNQFTDMLPNEIPMGLVSSPPKSTSFKLDELPFAISDVSELPDEVDWRLEGIVTPVKNQGRCGSCWAFSAISTLESHIAQQTGYLFTFSPQELVSCAPNQGHCGGNGGCTGATIEIGLDFVACHGGIVEEDYMGYHSGDGKGDGKCTIHDDDTSSSSSPLDIKGGVAGISGFSVLPSNNYTVLMNAIAKYGPVSVSVAANSWSSYESGVVMFDDNDDEDGKFTINHAVVLVGYGTDYETGVDYWLVRNSWSPLWGESGYIRLSREDPTKTDPIQCGIDEDTADGSSCIVNGTVVPTQKKVCGTCGILSESVIPLGGHLLKNNVEQVKLVATK